MLLRSIRGWMRGQALHVQVRVRAAVASAAAAAQRTGPELRSGLGRGNLNTSSLAR